MWKKIASKTLLQHPRLTVIEDEVELPNGKRTTYLRFGDGSDTHAAATLIAINREGKILVEKEYSYPPNKWIYQFPGGGVPENEDLAEGANRELMEEANYKAGKLVHIGKALIDNRRSHRYIHTFVATALSDASLPSDDEEEFEFYWLSETEIENLIAKGEIENVYMLAAWAHYKAWQRLIK
jgi:ADP-ribose pyrophosphatase